MQLLVEYLSETSPLLLVVHLIYIIMVCATLSVSYVVAFHWSTVVQIYTDAHDIRGFSVNLKSSVETDNKLNIILNDILQKPHAMRAYIYRFHDGLGTVSSVPFFFQSNTHEVISPGTSRLMGFEQRIPVSFNAAVNNQFVKNQCAVILNADHDPDSQNYYYFQTRQAKALIRCPIYMPNGDLFGFVGVDFAETPDLKGVGKDSDLDAIVELVSDAAKQIGSIFAANR